MALFYKNHSRIGIKNVFQSGPTRTNILFLFITHNKRNIYVRFTFIKTLVKSVTLVIFRTSIYSLVEILRMIREKMLKAVGFFCHTRIYLSKLALSLLRMCSIIILVDSGARRSIPFLCGAGTSVRLRASTNRTM